MSHWGPQGNDSIGPIGSVGESEGPPTDTITVSGRAWLRSLPLEIEGLWYGWADPTRIPNTNTAQYIVEVWGVAIPE